jgi:hypothetical protein
MPDDGEFSEMVDQARKAAEAIRSALPGKRPIVCVYVDVLASCGRSKDRKQVGQFAALIGPGCSDISLVAKGFPTVEEESFLAIPRTRDGLAARALETPAGLASILVCHDVNAYSKRGEGSTTQQQRQCWRSRIQNEIERAEPGFALHLVHLIEKPGSFAQAYRDSISGSESRSSELVAWPRALTTWGRFASWHKPFACPTTGRLLNCAKIFNN